MQNSVRAPSDDNLIQTAAERLSCPTLHNYLMNQGPLRPRALPGFLSTADLSVTSWRPEPALTSVRLVIPHHAIRLPALRETSAPARSLGSAAHAPPWVRACTRIRSQWSGAVRACTRSARDSDSTLRRSTGLH